MEEKNMEEVSIRLTSMLSSMQVSFPKGKGKEDPNSVTNKIKQLEKLVKFDYKIEILEKIMESLLPNVKTRIERAKKVEEELMQRISDEGIISEEDMIKLSEAFKLKLELRMTMNYVKKLFQQVKEDLELSLKNWLHNSGIEAAFNFGDHQD
ncbi:hypothetical protein HS088_TW14G00433 [Tripterygium wilfordii]|uniref:Uncharacterized protein n=1 Tax=Tripterygium wilfordii TaxID=458696 RepID=A0A7J7CQA0_TRIWF|nr:hypothetical protein HS088_TW14G00433 [Tripterygium wilfordii]